MEDLEWELWQQNCAALWQDRCSVGMEGDQGVNPHVCTSPEVVPFSLLQSEMYSKGSVVCRAVMGLI